MLNVDYDNQKSHNIAELLTTLVNDIPDLIIFKDERCRWISASKFAQSLFGLEKIPYIGRTSGELAQLTPIREYQDILRSREDEDEKAWISRRVIRSEVEFPQRDGQVVVLDVITTPLFHLDGSRRALVVIGRDITKQKNAEKNNVQLAYYDQLTNLPNRIFFQKELQNYIQISAALNQSFVVMSLDIDRFKYINDSLGPAIGDQLLIQISKRLNQALQNDWFLARTGGDEFAIIIPNANMTDEIMTVAQKLVDAISEGFTVNTHEIFTTTTIGICCFPQDGDDVQSLMKHAVIALNLAKNSGKNGYQVYGSKMDAATFKAFTLENDLKKAMSMDQFEVYYQPKVDTSTNKITGAEALIRWNHPEWGVISTKEFISIAEETGLIVPMGEWVKETVCRQMKEWQESGLKIVPVSINISAKRFMKKEFFSNVKRIIEEVGIDPSLLEIEITETALIENEELAIEVIQELRNYGMKVSLDDFGKGYSALSYLKQFKVDAVKIDRSFIKEISAKKQDQLVVKGIIQLIQNLDMNVIAEGVETLDQLHYLRKLNCNQVQGYLYSRPVKGEEYKELLKKGYIEVNDRQNEQNQDFINRRNYYRIPLTHPLLADMTIIKFMGKDITLGKADVLVSDIGLGGLSFISNIRMAVRPDMILSVATEILGESMTFVGRITWFEEKGEDVYQYGLEFLIDEEKRDDIAKILNPLSVKLRKNPILPDCRFIDTDARSYFHKKKSLA